MTFPRELPPIDPVALSDCVRGTLGGSNVAPFIHESAPGGVAGVGGCVDGKPFADASAVNPVIQNSHGSLHGKEGGFPLFYPPSDTFAAAVTSFPAGAKGDGCISPASIAHLIDDTSEPGSWREAIPFKFRD